MYDSDMEKTYWYSFTDYCKKAFGRKLYRVALDAGMTCPNRDGTCGDKGCIFCSAGGSGDFAIHYEGQSLSLEDFQYNHQCSDGQNYIAYFQSFTNTYASVERLRMLYTSALDNPLFAGISIATRPDCMQKDVLDLLHELQEMYPEKFIWVELGLQTMHEESAQYIRRGYPLSVFDQCVKQLHAIHIPVIVHMIVGLPNETEEMIYETVKYLNTLHIEGIKIQLLHYLSHTDLGELYLKDPSSFHVLSKEEYISITVHCIGLLDSSIVIHRLTGDGNGEFLLAPMWSTDKLQVLNGIRHSLKEKQICQGSIKE